MGSILIQLPKMENAIRIRDIIKGSGFWDDIIICHHGAEILNLVNNQDISIIICMRKISDMSYAELAQYLPGRIHMILLTNDESLVTSSPNVTKLLMPFRGEELITCINKLLPDKTGVKKKRLRTKEEQELIDRAKSYLMESREMTEPEAFRFMQKISMDKRSSLAATARMILESES